jgi:hypothetical protein
MEAARVRWLELLIPHTHPVAGQEGLGDLDVTSAVLALLRTAREAGRAARLVRISSFDDLMTNLARHALSEGSASPRRIE